MIGEFAFGTSEKSPTGSPSEKGLLGTVHFALGDNHNAYPGGQNVSTLHLDGNCLNASLLIEDTGVIHRQGRQVGAVGEPTITVVSRDEVDRHSAAQRKLEPDGSDRRRRRPGSPARSATPSSRREPPPDGRARSRRGRLRPRRPRRDSQRMATRCPFAAGQALHIPPGLWHAVANTGDEDVSWSLGFPIRTTHRRSGDERWPSTGNCSGTERRTRRR